MYATLSPGVIIIISDLNTVWPEILVGNLFWQIGSFESDLTIFPPAKFLNSIISLRTGYYVTSSTCAHRCSKCPHKSYKTSKEWNKNNSDLVYHQLVPALFNLLGFEMDSAVFTLHIIWLLRNHRKVRIATRLVIWHINLRVIGIVSKMFSCLIHNYAVIYNFQWFTIRSPI